MSDPKLGSWVGLFVKYMKTIKRILVNIFFLIQDWVYDGDLFGFVDLYRKRCDKFHLLYGGDVVWDSRTGTFFLILNGITGKMQCIKDGKKKHLDDEGYYKLYYSPRWHRILGWIEDKVFKHEKTNIA